MDISAKSLDVKRKVVSQLLEDGFYPYTKAYLGDFHNHFSTIGIVGMNEACENAKWINCNLLNKRAQDFSLKVLNHMRDRLSDYQEKYGNLFNLEATPAESTTYRLAKHDKEKYPDIITANEHGTPYYTNSTHLPVGEVGDIFEALDIEDPMQVLYTSGTVFHAFLGERLPNWQSASMLVKKIAENYKLPYFTLSPTYSVCPEHGYINGEVWKCPKCGAETEVYSRITGYYRPVKNWNDGKAQEFKDRKTYKIDYMETHIPEPKEEPVSVEEDKVKEEQQEDQRYLLFGTKTCPNCKIVKSVLERNSIKYEFIDADENGSLCEKYGVMQAPTLIVLDGKGGFTAYSNASAIIKFFNL